MEYSCAECARKLPSPKTDDRVPEGSVLLRLVRSPDGTEYEWGTANKTLAPSALVCDLCMSHFPRSNPPASVVPEVVVTRLPSLSSPPATDAERRAGQNARAIYQTDLSMMPDGEVIYSWPYYASCYLVRGERLRVTLPTTYAKLQESAVTSVNVEKSLTLLGKLLRFLRLPRGSGA